MEEVQKVEKMARTGNACLRVQQVKTSPFVFSPQSDWAGECRSAGHWKRGISRSISR